MTRLLTISAAVFSATSLLAEGPAALPLWQGKAPGALGEAEHDVPTVTVFPAAADKATGAAFVICPGGGYGGLAEHEGKIYAEWMAQRGVTGVVLKYRLGSKGYRHPVMLQDVARAIRMTRAKAGEWNIDPKRIGVMGSSAGGHLASTVLTQFDEGKADDADPIERVSSRPDLGILCYPVISMNAEVTHAGSRKNLLGDSPSEDLVTLLSNEKQVKPNTPATFIFHTWDDNAVKVENPLLFAAALRKAGVSCELHIYDKGPHGLGLGAKKTLSGQALHPWTTQLDLWLKKQGWVK